MAKLELRLRSWIPQDKIFFTATMGGSVYFKGDNRSSAQWSTLAYRSAQIFTIDTSTSQYTVSHTPKVNSTTSYLYNTNGELINSDTKTQGTSGLTYTKRYNSADDNLYLDCVCDVANPSVYGAPAINYEFTIKVTRAGSVRITGQHDGFPAYEFWRQIEGKSGAELVYTHNPVTTGDTMVSLFPPMEYDGVDVGLSYNS